MYKINIYKTFDDEVYDPETDSYILKEVWRGDVIKSLTFVNENVAESYLHLWVDRIRNGFYDLGVEMVEETVWSF